jgi:AraC family transcriptional regulator of adaptative response / DNA-3-methyladenine glycosylase II
MRLIEEGFLEKASVANLADNLGIGPRHLLRLFLHHAGATPSEVAATRRVQAAKRLIDQTAMPLSEIAFAAGFHSTGGSMTHFSRATGVRHPRFAAAARAGTPPDRDKGGRARGL